MSTTPFQSFYLDLFWRYLPFAIIIVILLLVLAPLAHNRQSLSLAAEASPDASGIDYTASLHFTELLYPAPSGLRLPLPMLRDLRLMRVTAYCPCKKCCGAYAAGITASGHVIIPGESFVAAPPEMAFGTTIYVPGYNQDEPVKVLDRGGAIKNDHLDVFFGDHKAARQWGVRHLTVTIETPDPAFQESSVVSRQSPAMEWKSVP